MHIHKDYTGSHEKCQLDQGMVYHVKHTASYSQKVFFTQQAGHTDAHQNKANLGDRGAGKGSL